MWMMLAAVAVVGISLSACGSTRVAGLPPMDSYILSGQLTGEGGAPLDYASVVLAGSPLGSVTDDQGRFGIDGVRAGAYGLTVVYLGYRSGEARITVPGDNEKTLLLDMVRDEKLGPAFADSLAPVTVNFTLSRAE
jgi:hypothetical protein